MPNRREYKREWERGKRDEIRKIRQVGRLIYRMIGREKGEEKKRGRKKKLKGSERFILLVLMGVKNYTFRDTASVAPLYPATPMEVMLSVVLFCKPHSYQPSSE